MPRDYQVRNFSPFPQRYSSVTFAPLLRSTVNYNHATYLLRNHAFLNIHLSYYGSLSRTISDMERTLQHLYDTRDNVFHSLATEEFVREIQPLLRRIHRETQRRPIPPTSSSSSSDHRPGQPRRPHRYRTPPQSPPAYRSPTHSPMASGSRLQPIVVSSATPPQVVRTPTPVPPPIRTRYTSPLLAAIPPPCPSCGGRDGHFRECMAQS